MADELGMRDSPQDTDADVCRFTFDSELHVAQIVLELGWP